MKALPIKSWIDTNLPPLSWNIVGLSMMKTLIKYKISAFKIDENTEFNDEIVSEMKKIVLEKYQKEIPNSF